MIFGTYTYALVRAGEIESVRIGRVDASISTPSTPTPSASRDGTPPH
jgi:hypothetical protein